MIAKGNTHRNGAKLAHYMTQGVDGERAELWQLCGFAAGNIEDAFRSVEVMADATRCEAPFFHLQVRNRDDETLTRNEWLRVVDRIEVKLGLTGQPRAIAFHIDEQTGHEHMHVAWSRIDADTLTARPLPFFKERLVETARQLEKELGLTPVSSQRRGLTQAPNRNEFEEARRLGVDVKEVRETIRRLWDRSDCGRSFENALADRGLLLARGDRRDFIIIDEAGGMHALGKRVLGIPAPQIRSRMSDLVVHQLPTVEQARQALDDARKREPIWDRDSADRQWQDAVARAGIERAKSERSKHKANTQTPDKLVGVAREIWLAYNGSRNAEEFRDKLQLCGLDLARITAEDEGNSRSHNQAAQGRDRYAPIFREGEYVVLSGKGHEYRLNERTTGTTTREVRELMRDLDRVPMASLAETRSVIDERRVRRIQAAINGRHMERGTNRALDEIIGKGAKLVPETARRVSSALDPAGKVLGGAANALESLLAPRLTPQQRRDGERADRVRSAAGDEALDQRRFLDSQAREMRRQEEDRAARRYRSDRDR